MTVKVTITKGDGYKRLQNLVNNMTTEVGKVGWFDSKKHPDSGKTVAEIAAQNELGDSSQRIPARPFFRPTIAEKKNSWRNLAASGVKAILAGNETMHSVLDKISQQAAGDCRKTITQIWQPKLSEFTISERRAARKLGKSQATGNLNKPLVDTGYMLNSLTSTVEKE